MSERIVRQLVVVPDSPAESVLVWTALNSTSSNSSPWDHFVIADYQTQQGIPFFSRGNPYAGMERRRFMSQICKLQLKTVSVVETANLLVNV